MTNVPFRGGREQASTQARALAQHLSQFPEDILDIRRLQRRYGLGAEDVARALHDLGGLGKPQGQGRDGSAGH